jgi:hypothetical protein
MSVTSKKYLVNEIINENVSSNIKGGKYNTTTKILEVTFNNGMVYQYEDVSHEVFAELNLAESQGKYFNANIAKKYSYKKVL